MALCGGGDREKEIFHFRHFQFRGREGLCSGFRLQRRRLRCTFKTALVERRREERGEIKSVQYAARRESEGVIRPRLVTPQK